MSSTVEVLQKAKEVLIEDGWIKDHIHHDNKHCSYGVILRACDLLQLPRPLDSFALQNGNPGYVATWIFERYIDPRHETGIGIWNDKPERTFDQVMAAFDAVILLAKEREAANG